MPNLNKLKELIFDILFPPLCLICKNHLNSTEKERGACNSCFSKIAVHSTLFCGVCRARLPENKKICHKKSLYLLGAATNYDENIRNIIHQFKYQYWTRLENIFEYILKIYLKNLQPEETLKRFLKKCLIIPIPLYKDREKERGFNQAEILGKIISQILSVPMENRILARIKETQSQAKLKNWEQRKENLNKSFEIKNLEKIKGINIILVDDVYTSGATINEAAKILRNAGAKQIIALVIAKRK